VSLTRRQVMVPQTHAPAEEAEVDFGEFTAVIGQVRQIPLDRLDRRPVLADHRPRLKPRRRHHHSLNEHETSR